MTSLMSSAGATKENTVLQWYVPVSVYLQRSRIMPLETMCDLICESGCGV
jgi:hypothetical protein